ncbi:GNAT family N-acetyltransferase [Agromyces endophyticus]|uniref:GNAT family N-acetyltransferase n=1 Tax=Agromyces sp. H17E-10 TaxID=2932244 RepID=UPI001FD24BEE|nr:GNAT family N-acetyltransferase [Agromyces sp. H17E-10]UOQ89489.1 GNAT family N-acetyltransferase [Agromyces sp. H17E-10]
MMSDLSDELEPYPLRVVPAGDAPFDDVEAVFGTKGDPAHCWCQWFKLAPADWRSTGDDDLRELLHRQLESAENGPGLLAYDDETPVGWCAVEPRPNLPRLRRSRIISGATTEPDFADESVWAVSCFVVPREYRMRGVGRALAAAAVEYAREHGARVLEGYAVDPAERAKTPAADLYHGTVSMFVDAGFSEVARPRPDRAIMQLQLG